MPAMFSEAGLPAPTPLHRGIESAFELAEGIMDESVPFIPVTEEEELESWSPESLGPGFIWIETGRYKYPSAFLPSHWERTNSHVRETKLIRIYSHILQCIPLWL